MVRPEDWQQFLRESGMDVMSTQTKCHFQPGYFDRLKEAIRDEDVCGLRASPR